MFMDRNTQYCQDVSPSQLHLQVQYNPNHIPESYFVDIYKLIPNCVWGDVTKMTLQEAPVAVLRQQLTIRRASKIKTALGELRIPLKKFQPHSRKKKPENNSQKGRINSSILPASSYPLGQHCSAPRENFPARKNSPHQ